MVRRENKNIITVKVRLWGVVQGVGFRPYIAKLALKYALTGAVRNSGGVVDISLTGNKNVIDSFIKAIIDNRPIASEIVSSEIKQCPLELYDEFSIEDSECGENDLVMLPPDLTVCNACISEMSEASNVRSDHPFISCMSCGPRYSVINRIPYDRCNTTMDKFEMCNFCKSEYTDTENRRFHAQTVSCNSCGPYLIYQDLDGIEYEKELALKKAVTDLRGGAILAVKGIGGYHLVCSPFKYKSVSDLRTLKGREEKPFAVMFSDIADIKKYCEASKLEEELLLSKAHPIVLLERKSSDIDPMVYRSSRQLGAFLPYTPLQKLLIDACGPLLMTSANISDMPIIIKDKAALELIGKGIAVLYNTREIMAGLDDSIAKVIGDKPQLLRRARGYVPLPFHLGQSFISKVSENQVNINSKELSQEIKHIAEKKPFFSSGGHLKSAFALTKSNFVYLSQHMGDLDNLENFYSYEENYKRLCSLLKIEPELAVCDIHPTWNSTLFAEKLGLPIFRVQHHHAHIASVMAEYNICEPVIGIAFDGTGYGTDGSMWGGEFLVCHKHTFERAGHLKYTKMTGGDSLAKDAQKTLTCYLLELGLEGRLFRGINTGVEKIESEQDDKSDINHENDMNVKIDNCDENEKSNRITNKGNVERTQNTQNINIHNDIVKTDMLRNALNSNFNTFFSSSMGRLFDAVSAYIGICNYNRYEGECGVTLENYAYRGIKNNQKPYLLNFDIENNIVDPAPVFFGIMEGRSRGASSEALALGFHIAVADAVLKICLSIKKEKGIGSCVLSGGVFQNTVLTEMCRDKLWHNGFKVYINSSVPPNDGGIALGQSYVYLHA